MREDSTDDADNVTADVLVIGAGPAGIAAAVSAATRGVRVVVMHHDLEPGGQIWRHRSGENVPAIAARWLQRLAQCGATVIGRASVVDARRLTESRRFEVIAERGGRPLRVHVTRVIVATGARELFIPFPGWTLPGIVGVGGAQALLKAGASFAARRVVIAGSGPLLLPVAAALAADGARLCTVAEQARGASLLRFGAGLWRTPAMAAQAARYRTRFISTRYRAGTWVAAAHGAGALERVTLTDGARSWSEPADMLCTGYGLVPNCEIARLLGCETRDGALVVDAVQGTTVSNVYAAGEVTGIGGAALSLIEGQIAGLSVSGTVSPMKDLVRKRAELQRTAKRMHDAFALRDELRTIVTPDTIVCRCEDVTYGSLCAARSARQAKLYTRVGMGPCQGRTCAPGLQFLLGWIADSVRPPIEPACVSTLASDCAECPSTTHTQEAAAWL